MRVCQRNNKIPLLDEIYIYIYIHIRGIFYTYESQVCVAFAPFHLCACCCVLNTTPSESQQRRSVGISLEFGAEESANWGARKRQTGHQMEPALRRALTCCCCVRLSYQMELLVVTVPRVLSG